MKKYMKILTSASAVLTLALLSGGFLQAASKPISITSQVNELIKQTNDQGQVQLVAIAPDSIVPGDRVLYTTRFHNKGAEVSDSITITNPIPQQVSYLAGSAQGKNCDIVFSADGGKSWGKPEQLKVQMADGQWRAAQASEYTHIRWQYQSVLSPQQSSEISYQAHLK